MDVKHLKCVLRLPVEFYPDPRILIEDGRDEQDRENKKKQEVEYEMQRKAEQKAEAERRAEDRLAKLREKQRDVGTDGDDTSSHGDYKSSRKSQTAKDSAMSPGDPSHRDGDPSQGQRSGPTSIRGQSVGRDEEDESSEEEPEDSDDMDDMKDLDQAGSQTEMKQELIDAIKEDLRIQMELKA